MLDRPVRGEQAEAAAGFDRARYLALAALIALSAIVIGVPALVGRGPTDTLAAHLAFRQDLLLLPVCAAALLLRPRAGTGKEWLRDTRWALLLALLGIILAGWAGHYLVFRGLSLSRDEQMAVFDQQIFAKGAVLWPIPPDWRAFADALGRRFMLPIGANEYWVSAYLPVHAAFRTLVSLVGDPALSSPLLTALAAACTWGIARKLWPQSGNVAVLALILLVTSSQVLIMAMTPFAMSMHLGLNMLWLLLFLENRWRTHVLAAAIGFLATGIHQPLFHPLFALPFCVLLLVRRQWGVAGFYAVAYAVIAAFWLAYPQWIVAHGSAPAIPIDCAQGNCSSGVGFVERLQATLTSVGLANLWLTASNLLRLIVWQHPLLVPLALFGGISFWRSEPLVKALAASILLPIVVMAIILPWQGHGWGYRYVHPVLGNAVLLACFGFHRLQQSQLSLTRPLAMASSLGIGLLMVHGWMAAQTVRPFAAVRDSLAAIPADIVIVDTDEVPFGQDVVVNRPDLTNRPKLLIASLVKPAQMAGLCAKGSIAFYDAPRLSGLARLFNGRPPAAPSADARALHIAAEKEKCRIIR